MAVVLTEKIILELPITGKQYDVYDAYEKGLILRVNKNGSKSYSFQYGRGKRIKFAKFGELPLKLVRLKARELIINAKNNLSISKPIYADLTFGNYLSEIDYPWMKANIRTADDTFNNLKAAFFPKFENKLLKDLSVKELELWKNTYVAKGLQKSSANRLIGPLKASLKRAEDFGYIEQSPLYKLKPFEIDETKRSRFLSSEERARLYATLPTFDKYFRVIVILALNTGLRRCSILSLRWTDVHFTEKKNFLVVDASNIKTKKTHTVGLNQSASEALIEWQKSSPAGSEWVFPSLSTDQTYIAARTVRRAWDQLMKLAKISNFKFRDQRHDCASSLVQLNVSLYKVSKILGHSSTKMTQRYAYLQDENLHDALCLLDSNKNSRNENLACGT